MYFHRDTHRVQLHGAWTRRDYFEINHITYLALPLDDADIDKGIGINSSVFRARPADGEGGTHIVKVCNYNDENTNPHVMRRRARFSREIEAMRLALEHGKDDSVVRLLGNGSVVLGKYRTHRCFLMEAANATLAEHLGGEERFTMQQRLLLCVELLRSVRALHDIGVYHRDIKPENVLSIGGHWKIADLGLVGFRDDDANWEGREKIGPPKWMSPEAVNKAYCLLRDDNDFIDRELDEHSDVYQIGKLSWYILQGDIPNGCLLSRDLVHGGDQMYGTFLKPMLGYRRPDRPTLKQVEERLRPLMRLYSIA